MPFDNDTKTPFFRKIDWASFWTATAVSFIVYFLTLGPSVGLEDSGELAVAGDHLGVPHPPGYPIWSMISYALARIFSFVTFRGQPNPAWAIALGSAIAGAFAAGCTAMLITRSASDMLGGLAGGEDGNGGDDGKAAGFLPEDRPGFFRSASFGDLICWVGGVAGSLLFAFSPVMWSQSTIVEVYSLGALFLMLVLLLTYRWMRRPSDKILWLTAFVFGLGLTNYQVLLLAALPLIVIIFLRNVALFRDFILVSIPMALGALILKVGALPMQRDLPKHAPIATPVAIPSRTLVLLGALAFMAALAVMVAVRCRRQATAGKSGRTAQVVAVSLAGAGVFLLLLSAVATFTGVVSEINPAGAVLVEPSRYAVVGALLVGVCSAFAMAATFGDDKSLFRGCVGAGALLSLAAFVVALTTPGATLPPGVAPASFPEAGVSLYNAAFAGGILLLVGLAAVTPRATLFAVPVAVVESVAYILVLRGAFLGLTHPSTWWFWAPVSFNFVVLALATLTLPNGASVAGTFLAGELGVSFYVYMPIVSDLRNPPMNWGYPRTWEGFKHAITRGQYEKIAPTDIFTPRFIHQVGDYFVDLRRQFTLLLAPFGFLPFAAWRLRRGAGADGRRDSARLVWLAGALAVFAAVLWAADSFVAEEAIGDKLAACFRWGAALALVAAVALAVHASVPPLGVAVVLIAMTVFFVVLGNIPAIERSFDASRIDKLTFGGLLLITAAGGLWIVYRQVEGAVLRILGIGEDEDGGAGGSPERDVSETVTVGLVVAALLLFCSALLYKVFQACAVFRIGSPLVAAGRILDANKRPVADIVTGWTSVFDAVMGGHKGLCIGLAGLAALLVVAGAVFGLWRLSRRKAVVSSIDDVSEQWLIGTVGNFLVMSVLLIMLANPKGDLQDTFIQKVKFISSHGLFALWIGYGLIFALVVADRFLAAVRVPRGARRALLLAAALAVFLTPAIPVEQNYCNDKLVFELSGAEQNGHDYGWQFGNYQLRGADAITEELEDDEEPLPNPSYPPAMGDGAVFFGGTDPGRFVPTYMIYSADVRPDVFLITQNALADNTFMSVTRDLYGDQLWIPTPKDSESAFGQFVDEVRSGKRPPNADIVYENGRVQVVGALGVMEINAILCKMIFEHNKRWHKFYVEESYVIQWMYPYLTPHGLIMHINEERVPLTAANVNDDMDFWDWYARRLTRDDRYRRDIVAQKSFSKLRSAIAGLYVNRGRIAEGERAYNDARILYPVSPEATFRYIQDILLRQERLDEAHEVVKFFCQKDPNNDRGPYVRNFITETKALRAELDALLAEGGAMAPSNAVRVADIYTKLGHDGAARALLGQYVSDPAMSIGDCIKAASILSSVGDAANATRAMLRVWKTKVVRDSSANLLVAIRVFRDGGDYEKLAELTPRYLAMKPDDWRVGLEWASICATMGNTDEALRALSNAVAKGGEDSLVAIEKSQILTQLFKELMRMRTSTRDPAGGGSGYTPFVAPGPRR